ncbi:hypothetical protein ScPMuIL_002410 [Solemya velum]
MRCLDMFLLLAVVVVCTFLSRANGGWTNSVLECKQRMEKCVANCYTKNPCYESCFRNYLRCLDRDTKQGEPTTECWRDKSVCYDRCQPYRLCSEKCEHDAGLCLVARDYSDK